MNFMPTAPDHQSFLKGLYQRLDDRSLEPGDPLYEPIYTRAGCEDPVTLMQKHIEWSENESIQMLSGFRGSGKTTELFRLKKALESQGYVVLYGDALEYLNPAQEIDISDLLIVLAGTFSDALEEEGLESIGKDSYWNRFKNYLTATNVNLDEAGLKAGAELTGAELKFKLKTTPTFRQMLREKLENRTGELKQNVNVFFEDGVKAIRQKRGQKFPGVVFLFDQMEQIRGTLSTEQSVIDSVVRLFAQNLKMLEMPYVHMVYTVPPWLKFVFPNLGCKMQILPSIRQWERDPDRTKCSDGWTALQSLVHRRFHGEDFQRFFGAKGPKHAQADCLIAVCGGHFRDLLLLLREAVLRVQSLPVSKDVIQSAINAVRSNFLPIAIEDAKWLDQIGRLRGPALPTTGQNDVNRLTRFLDTHFVLYFTNGTEWYDIHPLIRDEVAAIVAREAAKSPAPQT
jgi:hypothetical protein